MTFSNEDVIVCAHTNRKHVLMMYRRGPKEVLFGKVNGWSLRGCKRLDHALDLVLQKGRIFDVND